MPCHKHLRIHASIRVCLCQLACVCRWPSDTIRSQSAIAARHFIPFLTRFHSVTHLYEFFSFNSANTTKCSMANVLHVYDIFVSISNDIDHLSVWCARALWVKWLMPCQWCWWLIIITMLRPEQFYFVLFFHCILPSWFDC